jgi:DNA-binding MarR family transcriptional regulator
MPKLQRDRFENTIYNFLVLSCERITKPFENHYKSELSMKQLQAMCVLHTYGCMTMSELASRLEVTKQQVTQIINGLVAKNYVERSYEKTDRRIVRVSNTELGMKHIDEGDDVFIEKMRYRMSALNEKDFSDLIDAMSVINRIMPLTDIYNKNQK